MDKFPKFEKLHGDSNFHSWKMMVFAYMDVYNLYKIVIGEEKDPALTSSDPETSNKNYSILHKEYLEKCEDWRHRQSLARAFILFNVDSNIAPLITCYSDALNMWKTLNDLYDKRNEYSLHALVKSVVGIKCNLKSDVADHIAKYNELWSRLVERTAKTSKEDSDSLEAVLRPLANSPRAKGSLFLTTLPEELDNIVDNLKTKQNLTYDDVCSRLLELSLNSTTNNDINKAYVSKQKKDYKVNDFKPKVKKECSFCKSKKKWYKGHTLENCRNKKKEENANIVNSSENECNDIDIAFPASTSYRTNNKWIFDTGATSHMTGNEQVFDNLRPYEGIVRLGDGNGVQITHIGNVKLSALLPSGATKNIVLHDVLYVPDLKCSLMSWKTIRSKGITMKGDNDINLFKDGEMVGWIVEENKENIFQVANCAVANVSVQTWHRRLGHIPITNFGAVKEAVADPDVLPNERIMIDCEACEKSKISRKICKDPGNSCSEILEKIHSDVAGPFSTKSLGGKSYYISFIDEFSRYAEVVFISNKSEVEKTVREYIAKIELQTGKRVKIFKCDNGGEYSSTSLLNYLTNNGIKMENSIPHIHETNGLAERYNRTIITMSRTSLIDSELSQSLWAEAVAHAVYTKNRLPQCN